MNDLPRRKKDIDNVGDKQEADELSRALRSYKPEDQEGYNHEFTVAPRIIYGTRSSNRNRAYDITIFGEWIRFQREEVKGWTLQQAADSWTEYVGSRKSPPSRAWIAADWRRFELFGKQRRNSRQVYKGDYQPNVCREIALSLDIAEDDVRVAAGFQPLNALEYADIILLSQRMHPEDYQALLNYAINLHKNRRQINKVQQGQPDNHTHTQQQNSTTG